MAEKRVIEQTASSEIYNDDWFLKDSVLEGTTKISKDNLIDKIGASKINSIAEDYDSTSTYNKDDFAFYENKLYRCLANNTTGTWDGTKWEEFDLPTALITTAHNIETAEFTIGTYYSADDLVLKDGKLYQCVVFHNATEWKSQFWNAVTIDEMLEYISNSIALEHNQSTVYAVGDLVMHNKALWRCIQAGAGAFVNANWELVTVADLIAEAGKIDDVQVKTTGDYATVVENKIAKIDLSNKADKDGMYDELYAGNLVTDMHTSDNKPYLYRQSPSASSVSQNIVGGTVAWNQLVQNGDFANTTRWDYPSGTFSVADNIGTFTAQSQGQQVTQIIPYILNHKYLGIMQIKTTTATESVWLRFYGQNKVHTTATTNWQTVATIVNSIVDSTNSFGVRDDRTSSWDAIQIKNANLYDLTQAFGNTIADYVYSLEQAEAGSGIAWLKSYGFLTKDYYAYQSGKLESVNVASRKIVGKNLFDIHIDKDTQLTTITLAQPINQPITISAVNNNITVNDNVWRITITLKDGTTVRIGEQGFWGGTFPKTINGSDANPIVSISYRGENITSGSYDVQVEYGSTATAYEPYKEVSYPLDSSLTLRGILKKDANNNLYYDGDVYNADGSVKRKRTQLVLDGLKSYGSIQVDTNTVRAYIQINDMMPNNTTTINIVSAFYTYAPDYLYSSTNDVEGVCENKNATTNGIWFRITKSKLSSYDVPGLRAYLANNPITVEYELKTPTTESAQPFTNPQLVGSTEEFIDTRDVPIPVGGERKYYTDLKAKLEELAKIPDVPSTNGTYTLKATRSASGVEYNWVSG